MEGTYGQTFREYGIWTPYSIILYKNIVEVFALADSKAVVISKE